MSTKASTFSRYQRRVGNGVDEEWKARLVILCCRQDAKFNPDTAHYDRNQTMKTVNMVDETRRIQS